MIYDPQDRLVLCTTKYRRVFHDSAHVIVEGPRLSPSCAMAWRVVPTATRWGAVDNGWPSAAAPPLGQLHLVQTLTDGRILRVLERKAPRQPTQWVSLTSPTWCARSKAPKPRPRPEPVPGQHEPRDPHAHERHSGLAVHAASTDLDPQQLDYTSKTEGAARALLGLLNDILDFSKVRRRAR